MPGNNIPTASNLGKGKRKALSQPLVTCKKALGSIDELD